MASLTNPNDYTMVTLQRADQGVLINLEHGRRERLLIKSGGGGGEGGCDHTDLLYKDLLGGRARARAGPGSPAGRAAPAAADGSPASAASGAAGSGEPDSSLAVRTLQAELRDCRAKLHLFETQKTAAAFRAARRESTHKKARARGQKLLFDSDSDNAESLSTPPRLPRAAGEQPQLRSPADRAPPPPGPSRIPRPVRRPSPLLGLEVEKLRERKEGLIEDINDLLNAAKVWFGGAQTNRRVQLDDVRKLMKQNQQFKVGIKTFRKENDTLLMDVSWLRSENMILKNKIRRREEEDAARRRAAAPPRRAHRNRGLIAAAAAAAATRARLGQSPPSGGGRRKRKSKKRHKRKYKTRRKKRITDIKK